MVQSSAKLLEEWRRYSENLLNAEEEKTSFNVDIPPAAEDLPIPTGEFTLSEVQQAIKRLNNYKAPGCDYVICAEI